MENMNSSFSIHNSSQFTRMDCWGMQTKHHRSLNGSEEMRFGSFKLLTSHSTVSPKSALRVMKVSHLEMVVYVLGRIKQIKLI